MCIAPVALMLEYFGDYTSSRERDLQNGANSVRSFSHMYAEQVSRSLAGVDLLIDEQTKVLAAQPLWPDWPESRGHDLLHAHKPLYLPQLRDTAIFDESGRQRFHSSLFPAPAINISERPYFKEILAGARRVLWGPFKGGNSGLMTYAVTRRIFKSDGSFGGVAFAAIELAQFQATCWNGKSVDELMAFLVNAQGVIVAECRPPDEVVLGVSRIGKRLESSYPPLTKLDWRSEGVSISDEQIVSVRRVADYEELSIVVSLPIGAVLQDWTQHQKRNQLTLAAVLLIVLGCFRYIWLQMQKQDRAEATLRKLSLAVEQSSTSIMISNRNTEIEYVNDAFTFNTGYRREEVLGRTPNMMASGKTPSATYRSLWLALEQGQSWQGEFINRRKDGSEHVEFANISPLRNEDGVVTHYVAVHEDVTEKQRLGAELEQHRHHLEELVDARTTALRHQSYSLQALIDNVPHMAWMKDKDGRFIAVNRGVADAFGYTTAELIGKADLDFLPRPLAERNRAEDVEVMETRRMKVIEESAAAVPGSLYEIFKAPIFDADGSVLGTVGFARDIKPQRALEAELALRAEAAESASLAKSSFLSNMSHEIRTPMNAIVGLTHVLRRQTRLPGHIDKLGKIASAADHLLGIINDILDISKIESGKMVLEQIDFELDAVLSRVSSMVAERVREKGLELIVDAPLDLNVVNGDAIRLGQALLNYLGNAVKFTESGSITLRTRVMETSAVDVVIRFEVEDTGIGIAADDLPRLFQSFHQADSSTTRRFGGTGLGLAITRSLAQLMGGSVGVTSSRQRGSLFWMTARLGRSTQQSGKYLVAALKGKRALVVDDTSVTRMVQSQLLRLTGLESETAASGESALKAVIDADGRGEAFDLVLIDLLMEDMDGFETLRSLRRLALQRQPTAILVTASGSEAILGEALSAGFADVLLKPLSAASLHNSLAGHQAVIMGQAAVQAADLDRSISGSEAELRRDHRNARILLVEDDPLNQEVALLLLGHIGWTIDVAMNGKEALARVSSQSFDMILMDMQMPVMGGLEATRSIRRLPQGKVVPILAMTANAFTDDREACLDAGMNDFISKPCDPEVLFSTMLKWLQQGA